MSHQMTTSGSLQVSQNALLTIRLFGNLEVILSGNVLVQLPSRRAGWLLAILALRRGRPSARQSLAGQLWPDSPDGAALHNLRQTLAALRRALGPAGSYIESLPPHSILLRPDPDIFVDALSFDDIVAGASPLDLEKALSLFTGPLVEGCDEPFIIGEREIRDRAFVAAAEQLAEHHIFAGEHTKAIATIRRSLDLDPYRESAHRVLMNSMVESGEAAAALEQYRSLRLLLSRDLNAEPDPETKALYRKIRLRITSGVGPASVGTAKENRVPVPLSPLVGRESSIKAVASLLDHSRLVTLTGLGGVGKTRLAIAIANEVSDKFADGARFVDLAPLTEASAIGPAIAAVVGIPEQAEQSMDETVTKGLKDSELVLILDNCEHLAEAVATMVAKILEKTTSLRIVATSRQSLGVDGELLFPVPCLSLPEPMSRQPSPTRVAELHRSEAVSLFLDRSTRFGGPQAPSSDELECIGRICRKLDGLPLAIELAAARMKVLSVFDIEKRLDDRFALLAASNRTNPRQQTLRAAIEWSWDLLSEPEKRFMTTLCVFKGGCTIEAAEAVFPGEGEQNDVLDLLSSLLDRSFVNASRNSESSRFWMLETVREFVWGLRHDEPEWKLSCDRHLDYFLSLVEAGVNHMHTSETTLVFRRLEADHDNLRSALEWCASSGKPSLELRLAATLSRFWDTHGHLQEGRMRLEAALGRASTDVPQDLIATVNFQLGWMATVQRDCRAAIRYYRAALPHYLEERSELEAGKLFNCMATAHYYLGDIETAQAQFEQSLSIHKRHGDNRMVAAVLNNLGEMALQGDRLREAREYLEQSLHHRDQSSSVHPEGRAQTLVNLSVTNYKEEKYDEAKMHAWEALQLFSDWDLFVSIPGTLDLVAIIEAKFGHWTRSATLAGASESLAISLSVPLSDLLLQERKLAVEACMESLGHELFRSRHVEGRRTRLEERIGYALSGEFALDG